MTVYLVGAGPGDPGLLTRKGADLLARADVVIYDRLVDPALLLLARPGAALIDVGKRADAGAQRQQHINELLIEHARTGRMVLRLKGGDPFVFGRGGEEAEALDAAGIDYAVVPGVTSATAVPAMAGIPVTHRGLASSVTFVTGRVGDPTAPGGVDRQSLARAEGTIVILMGMAVKGEIADALMAGGRSPGTPVAVIEWGTTARQRVTRTTLASLGALDRPSPAVIVVGAVAALELFGSPRPLEGRTIVVTRAATQAAGLVTALANEGARVMELPVLRIADPPDGGIALDKAMSEVSKYAWIVFTSANGVEAFAARLRDARALGNARLAAVGPATAAALASWHLVADLVATKETAAGLVAPFPEATGGGRVLYPKAERAKEALGEGLHAKGWEVDEVVVYRSVPAPGPAPETLAAISDADAIVFASPSAIEAFGALRDADGNAVAGAPVVACIGPVTATAARSAAFPVVLEAPHPDVESLVSVLSLYFAGRGQT